MVRGSGRAAFPSRQSRRWTGPRRIRWRCSFRRCSYGSFRRGRRRSRRLSSARPMRCTARCSRISRRDHSLVGGAAKGMACAASMSPTGVRRRRTCASFRSTIISPTSTSRSTRSARRSILSGCARADGCRWSMPRVFRARCGGWCWPARRSISPRRQNSRGWWPRFRKQRSSRWCSRATASSAASTCSGSGTCRSASDDVEAVLQRNLGDGSDEAGMLLDRFGRWDRATLDLPGTYYLEVTERVFGRT